MLAYIDHLKTELYEWFLEKARHRQALKWLAGISFLESIVFPIPTAGFLLLILVARAKEWFYIASVTTLFSVIGGAVGYFAAYFFFDTIGIHIIEFYHLEGYMDEAKQLFGGNTFLVTFIAAFTPIPYKVLVLSAGFLKVNFFQFILASIFGRGLQFFIIGFVMRLFGPAMTKVFLKYFNAILAIIGILALVYIISSR